MLNGLSQVLGQKRSRSGTPRYGADSTRVRPSLIGRVLTLTFHLQGYRTLDDLRGAKLSRPQQVGLRHYYVRKMTNQPTFTSQPFSPSAVLEQDFQQRIPREEARLLEKQVKKAVKAMSPHLKAVTCGSYR